MDSTDGGSRATDWPTLHEELVEAFATAWAAPHPHAWDEILGPDVVLAQPMLPTTHGREAWARESARLLTLLPDVRVEVVDWSGRDDLLFIRIRFDATLAGRPVTWEAVDVMRVSEAGTILRRDSYFDPTQTMAQVARTPRAWSRWWRSGLAPLTFRQRFLRRG